MNLLNRHSFIRVFCLFAILCTAGKCQCDEAGGTWAGVDGSADVGCCLHADGEFESVGGADCGDTNCTETEEGPAVPLWLADELEAYEESEVAAGGGFNNKACQNFCRTGCHSGISETLCMEACAAANAIANIACIKADGTHTNLYVECTALCNATFTQKGFRDKCYGGCHLIDIEVCKL